MGSRAADVTGTEGVPSVSRFRWWLVGVVLLVVVAAAVAAVLIVVGRKVEGRPQAASLPGLPAQTLLASSMRKQPVPGWKVTVKQLGLPPGTAVKPLRNVGERGYFLGITAKGWWLVGVDLGRGQRLFAPVPIGTAENALSIDCFVNGPAMVLCIREDRDPNRPARTSVVDAEKGTLVFDGESDLRTSPAADHPTLWQVGDYVVAEVTGKGIYGVGPHTELTWFVAGAGTLSASEFEKWSRDVAPQALAVQHGTRAGDVVFSVADGKVVKPAMPKDRQLWSAIAYPNGFGYEYRSETDRVDRVAFFDNSGKELSQPESPGSLRIGPFDVPMVETESKDVIFTLDGRKLLELPKSERMPYARLIGTKLFITTDKSQRIWQQYDLRTGARGKTCDNEDLGFGYIGSDGAVAVIADGTSARAIDLVTCDPLWSLPQETQETAIEVWKVNTTLIQRTNDELFSLVSPK